MERVGLTGKIPERVAALTYLQILLSLCKSSLAASNSIIAPFFFFFFLFVRHTLDLCDDYRFIKKSINWDHTNKLGEFEEPTNAVSLLLVTTII
ncbi:hypothetical protein CICLE_v10023057mg [Citrus x clementina]|uniref:Uncharacterized protein n=1 Tax=Citrus clementina TaxID=85681 RepID=V4TRB4_CITCL|nr:hypothetical protein CICLE_v10023057mg [Citrus x clementina]